MVIGSWLMAQKARGSRTRKIGARVPGLGDAAPNFSWPWVTSLGAAAMSFEPWTMNNRLIHKFFDYILYVFWDRHDPRIPIPTPAPLCVKVLTFFESVWFVLLNQWPSDGNLLIDYLRIYWLMNMPHISKFSTESENQHFRFDGISRCRTQNTLQSGARNLPFVPATNVKWQAMDAFSQIIACCRRQPFGILVCASLYLYGIDKYRSYLKPHATNYIVFNSACCELHRIWYHM